MVGLLLFFSVLTDGGTILNGLRFALAMYSGKNIFISRLLRPAGRNKRYFHRWGRGGRLHLYAKASPFEERLPPRRGKMSRSDKKGSVDLRSKDGEGEPGRVLQGCYSDIRH